MDAAFWDARYGKKEYVYGEEPNKYLAEKLAGVTPGKILFPADGEGRNSVYAATLGWEASAFDQSAEGKRKAEQLAAKNGVTINYKVAGLPGVEYTAEEFDAVVLIFAHFPDTEKPLFLAQLSSYLKPGGLVIFEAYSKEHIKFNSVNPSVGGPGDARLLYSKEQLAEIFKNYDVLELEEKEVEIWEGSFHGGLSAVVRFVGRKRI
jgi:cyclopropane fatty-acyl-phospholipid synthase-like methyltransferase